MSNPWRSQRRRVQQAALDASGIPIPAAAAARLPPAGRNRRLLGGLTVLAAVAAALLASAGRSPAVALGWAARSVTVAVLSRAEMAAVAGEPHLTTAHFSIAYPAGDAADASIVSRSLARYYPEVTAHFGVHPQGRLPVRIETAAGMARVFGSSGGSPPIGAYWRGVLWFLAPSDWLGRNQASYDRYGPVPHEMAHEMDDMRTAGALPAWLDEGVAQFEEWRDNGYVWRDAANRLNQPLYSWRQLQSGFYRLPNQALAYREAFLVVRSLGPRGVNRLLTDIAAGESADHALAAIVGPARYRALAAGAAWRQPGTGGAAAHLAGGGPPPARGGSGGA